MNDEILFFFAATPKGMEDLLAAELRTLGADSVEVARAGASFRGPLATGYRVCLWSRLASRVLLSLGQFPVKTPDDLYDGVRTVRWDEHLDPEGSLAVDFTGSGSGITHTHFGALKVKDAVVDQFRERYGVRPSVERDRPRVRLNLSLHRGRARLSLDLSGESLHRRGYREEGVLAPLKENLAAAILTLSGWPQVAEAGGPFLDPMCGSGTLPIEAALLAGDAAPGLLREYFGFLGWRGHDAALWEELRREARNRRESGMANLPVILGYDSQASAIRSALANVQRAGLSGKVHIERRDLLQAAPPGSGLPGLLVVNPPYGERLGEESELVPLYSALGELLRDRFAGWRAAIFTGNPRLALRLGVSPERTDTLYNGPLECRLLTFPATSAESSLPMGAGGEMFSNRLRKNLRNLGKWARREGIFCYRLYDADLPEYALAVDLYGNDEVWAHVQEYEAPKTVDAARAEERLRAALAEIPRVLEIPPSRVIFKVRRKQKGGGQYGKMASTQRFHEVREGGCRFLVNFTDYLDTGLFLDHRPTRALIGRLAQGKRFLNLFGYTGAATVHAAAGGALSTTTVDLSQTYLDWARRNLELNGFRGTRHELVQADVLKWLAQAARQKGPRYGLIFFDPPTFSNSKRMSGIFDVQRDHPALIRQAASLLEPDGILLFSTNFRRFRLDAEALSGLNLEDITRETIPQDFARNPRIHSCWKISRPT